VTKTRRLRPDTWHLRP